VSIYQFAPAPNFDVSEHRFVTWQGGFSTEELDKIIKYAENLRLSEATVGADNNSPSPDVRVSKTAWIKCNSETNWIYERLAFICQQLNGQFYKFDLWGFVEDMQYTVYHGDEEGHYTWHMDSGPGSNRPPRKFSIILQLSAPSDYEGGELELITGPETTQVTQERGLIAAFPSYTMHRVKSVTKGIRRSLVVWVSGPAFK
jgi:PKHD-type hydroxylase